MRIEEDGIKNLKRGWEGMQRGNYCITSEFSSMPKRPLKVPLYDKTFSLSNSKYRLLALLKTSVFMTPHGLICHSSQ